MEAESPSVTLVDYARNWSVDYVKDKLTKAKMLLVESIADTVLRRSRKDGATRLSKHRLLPELTKITRHQVADAERPTS